MTIIKWSPAREIASLQQGINRLFEDVFSQPGSYDPDNMGAWRPPVDIVDTTEAILIYAEIPGVDKDEVDIEVKDNVLTIKGERESEKKEEKEGFKRVEREWGSFYRRFSLPDTADAEKISAKSKHGVLEITIPKQEKVQPRKISVDS